MIEQVLKRKNLYKAYRQVVKNKGAAGVDKMKVTDLAEYLEEHRNRILTSVINHTYIPQPIKGVEIPKSNGKMRLLGVPTVVDRWLQQAVSQVLSSKFELTFEPNSYGFRPGRSCHDAIAAIFTAIGHKAKYVLDADIEKCFDRIAQDPLLAKLSPSPYLRRQLQAWLKAGVLDHGTNRPVVRPTPLLGEKLSRIWFQRVTAERVPRSQALPSSTFAVVLPTGKPIPRAGSPLLSGKAASGDVAEAA
jgi:RNA-directed DNA polymerase